MNSTSINDSQVVVSNPEDIKYCLVNLNLPQGNAFNYAMSTVYPKSLHVARDKVHRSMRRPIGEGFTTDSLRGFARHIEAASTVLIEKLDDACDQNKVVDMDACLTRCLLDSILRIGSGSKTSSKVQTEPKNSFSEALQQVFTGTGKYVSALPTP